MLKRSATAQWQGNGPEGQGVLKTQSGALSGTPYSFSTRFKNEDGMAGTNPEELIAAAHSGCFSMALAFQVAAAGLTPDFIETTAVVSMDQIPGGFEIQKIELNVQARISQMSEKTFHELAEKTKATCPVSKALSVPIEMTAQLLNTDAEMSLSDVSI